MTLTQVIHRLKAGEDSPEAILESCLAAARNPDGEGVRVFTEIFAADANSAVGLARQRLRGGVGRALEGVPISVKDLFDVSGSVTRAGSRASPHVAPASADADAVALLRAAGAIIVGKTNMTEFAYSGVGLNPHFGTPLNPYDRDTERIPGGSSSGAAVSVSDRMAFAALGTDTGGSIRIPAALCGLVGWKPTAYGVSLGGVLPLSPTLDSVGPIARDVAGCALIDSILTGRARGAERGDQSPSRVRLAIPTGLFHRDLDAAVATAMERALRLLSRSGVVLVELPLPEIAQVPDGGAAPVIVASEAYAWHRDNLSKNGDRYDPRVRARLNRGAAYSAWEYVNALNCRASNIASASIALQGFDGWLMPTVPVIAPPMEGCSQDEHFTRINALLLRNPSIVNFLNGCAISLPCHLPGEAPVGLTLAGLAGKDAQILAIASTIEQTFNQEIQDAAGL